MRLLKAIARRRSGAIGLGLIGVVISLALIGPIAGLADPLVITGEALEPPSLRHLMGTDALGRDLFSGVISGAGASLTVAIGAAVLASVCGISIGMIAGYRGGFVDDALMRVTELFQVMPRFFLVVVTLGLFGPGTSRVVLILGLTSWAVLARVVRAEVIATRNLDFVLSSEALGASRKHVLLNVLLPHVIPSALIMLGLILSQLLLIEASLGFIGLGDPGTVTWGLLAGQAQGFLRVAWWLPLFPGLAITVTVLGFNLLADAFSAVSRAGLPPGDEATARL